MKNTRLFYRDDAETFASLNPEDCQRLLLACLNYEMGEDASLYFEQGDPLRCLFLQLKKKIDINEKKYAETSKKRSEAANTRWHQSNHDITPDSSFQEQAQISQNKPLQEPAQSSLPKVVIPPVNEPENRQRKEDMNQFKNVIPVAPSNHDFNSEVLPEPKPELAYNPVQTMAQLTEDDIVKLQHYMGRCESIAREVKENPGNYSIMSEGHQKMVGILQNVNIPSYKADSLMSYAMDRIAS